MFAVPRKLERRKAATDDHSWRRRTAMTTSHSQQLATYASRHSHGYHLMVSIVIVVMTTVSSASAVVGCPERCDCRQLATGGTVVDCRGRHLTAIASEFPSDAVELDFGNNPIGNISRNTFPSAASKVRRLRMDGCLLDRLERMNFGNLQLLEVLDLSGNMIRTVADGAFQGLQHLRHLNLNRNNIQSPPSYLFRGLNLDELRFGGNGLQEISEELFGAAKIRSLNLDHNNLTSLDRPFLLPLEPFLKALSVSNNSRPLKVAEEAFSGVNLTTLTIVSSQLDSAKFLSHTTATHIDLSGNRLGYIFLPTPSNSLRSSCRELRLSDVGLATLEENLLSSLQRVNHLDLSANQLEIFIPELFRYTPDLSFLDLSRNRFVRLPEGFGSQLYNLETLNLSRCRIGGLGWEDFRAMPHLRVLDLSGNRLQVIPQNASSLLESIAALNLSGNPWHCNCEMQWFRYWLAVETRQVGSIRCSSPVQDILLNRDPATFVCTSPQITLITQSQNVREGSNVLLNCAAQSDPAPAIVWRAPFGDVLSITPPEDRTRTKTIADWAINFIRPYQSGWYSCNCTNIIQSNITYTYLQVVGTYDLEMDLTNLTYPMIPTRPITPTETTGDNSKPVSTALNEPKSASIKETTAAHVTTSQGIQRISTVLQETTHRQPVHRVSTFGPSTISDWDEVDGYIISKTTSVGFDRGSLVSSSSSSPSNSISSSERATGSAGDVAAETGQAVVLSKQLIVIIVVVILVVLMVSLVFGVLGVIVYRKKCSKKYPVNPRDGRRLSRGDDASEKTKLQLSNLDDSGYSSTAADHLNPPSSKNNRV